MDALGECTAVDNSKAALAAFDKAVADDAPFDLITLDVSMPEMDGRQVLQAIRKRELAKKMPKADRVKIIMVTARMNMATIKTCIKLGCNGYLSKPVTRFQLLETFGKLGFDIPEELKATTANTHTQAVAEIIERFYSGKIALPVFPHVVQEVQALLSSKDAAIDELEAIIKKDIVISSKLISIANSALYKGFEETATLHAALLRMGIKAAQGAVSSVAARHLFDSKNQALKAQLQKLWMHSFATACMGKALAKEMEGVNEESVFLMGIVHDIGKMLLMKAFSDIQPDQALDDSKLQTAIHEIHTTFGAVLLKKLRFAKNVVHVAEFHHWNAYSEEIDPELLVVNLADHLSYLTGYGFMEYESPITEEEIQSLASFKGLGLDGEKVLEIAETVKQTISESANAF